jgi:hypothetical protein
MFNTFMGFEPITLNFRDPFKHSWKPNFLQCNWKVKSKAKIAKWNEKQNRIKKMMRKTAGVDKYLWPKFDVSILDFPFIQFLVLLSFFFFNILKRFSSVDLKGNLIFWINFSTHFKKMKGSKEDVGRCFYFELC